MLTMIDFILKCIEFTNEEVNNLTLRSNPIVERLGAITRNSQVIQFYAMNRIDSEALFSVLVART
jgi:hypothetical protein